MCQLSLSSSSLLLHFITKRYFVVQITEKKTFCLTFFCILPLNLHMIREATEP